jgi:hypothetical protein
VVWVSHIEWSRRAFHGLAEKLPLRFCDISVRLKRMTPIPLTKRRPPTPETGEGGAEITFRGWRVDIHTYLVEYSGRWSSGVTITRAGTSEQIKIMEIFADYKTAWLASLEAGLMRVDGLNGGRCENSLVMIHHVTRCRFRS